MYIALTYIGDLYTPGEIIPDDLPPEKLAWLKKAGAIKVAPAPEETEAQDAPREAAEPQPETKRAEAERAEEAPEEDADGPEEIDEADEAPEIDLMEGLVTAPATEETPAKKPAGKRKGGKTK